MAAPPAPPPPPPPQSTPPLLSSGWRTSANSHRQVHNTISSPRKPTAPRLDPQTLQHAAAGLRKTKYNESLWCDVEGLPDGRMDRSDQQLYQRHRPNNAFNGEMASDKARETFYASPFDTRDVMPIGDVHQHTDSLKSQERPYQTYSSSSSSYNYSSQQNSNSGNNNNNNNDNNNGNRTSAYITNPQTYIHAYATQTPITTLLEPSSTPNNRQLQAKGSLSNQSPKVPFVSEQEKFAKELRNQGLTKTQRIANLNQQSQLRNVPFPDSIQNVLQTKERLGNDEIDLLIRDMEWKMKAGREDSTDLASAGATLPNANQNNCCKCGETISNGQPGCTALDQLYHVACFVCKTCGKQLAGSSFYNVDGQPMCEKDYVNTLERCTSCGLPIQEKLLRATGGTYHPACFTCFQCKKCLDGVPFTVDATNNVFCVTCFHDKFAPRCAICSKPIVPDEGEKESVRVVAMDKSFHVNCYRCEDCNMQLSSKIEGQGCYPLDQHLYCKNCNSKRLIAISSKVS